MSETTEQGKRQEKRDSLFLSATVKIAEFPGFTTRVRNLSAGGMMIDTDIELAPGMRVIAELRGIGEVPGRVAWTAMGRAGIAFNREVDPRLARAGALGPKSVQPIYVKHEPGRRPGLAIR